MSYENDPKTSVSAKENEPLTPSPRVQRVCLRCLLREMSEADVSFDVAKYIEKLKPEDKIDDIEYERRLSVCKECDLLNAGTCNACGCYVEIRAAGAKSHCPKKRW